MLYHRRHSRYSIRKRQYACALLFCRRTHPAIAERIVKLTGADIHRIEAAEPYAANPYDDSDRIQHEAYNDLRPGVANLLDKEALAKYDTIFVGSPCWWHQPQW